MLRLQELGYRVRRARTALGLTQSQLASAAHLTRPTLNQLENGLIRDLGIAKVNAVLDRLGLTLEIHEVTKVPHPDYLRIAATSASVSFRTALTEEELLRSMLTARVPANRRPHLRWLLTEAPAAMLEGLVQQVAQWTKVGKVEKNLAKIARELGVRLGATA